MNLTEITPMILTFNEEENIGKCLAGLGWAARVLVVDSGSTDATLQICAKHPNVEVIQRPFDSFADQCNHGLANIGTEWTLSLDADYEVPPEFVDEIRTMCPSPQANAYASRFVYAVFGQSLRGSLYPPRKILYRTKSAHYEKDGHAHRVHIPGEVGKLTCPVVHDDHKPLSRWFQNQLVYASQEAGKLRAADPDELGLADKIRCWRVVAPLAILPYCLIVRGAILDGRAGWYYATQRFVAEALLSLMLLDHDLRGTTRKNP